MRATHALGCIADDLTGSVDLAGRLVRDGATVALHVGVPDRSTATDADAVVVALKSRSIAPKEAIEQSLRAARWLRAAGCERLYLKYAATFDSTARGNIGPVADALMRELGVAYTVLAPSLPEHGRTVVHGTLFVHGVPLAESAMRNHPINPMRESDLRTLIGRQSRGRAAVVPIDTVHEGPDAVQRELEVSAASGATYVVLDAVSDDDLAVLGQACAPLPLSTGASALAAEILRQLLAVRDNPEAPDSRRAPAVECADPGRAVALAGSCSAATAAQVAVFRQSARSFPLALAMKAGRPAAVAEALAWVRSQPAEPLLVYSTPQAGGEHSTVNVDSAEVEAAFGELAAALLHDGFSRFVVAGGETSGAVVQALGTRALDIGAEVQPGVPAAFGLTPTGRRVGVVLKSGNFGYENFFAAALEEIS
ncbi:3-oxo-tetronate kinase [Jiangella asiatica]|uniref:3-oxo-tetronate kinase n=1 Tax=Jiangella asiatica TaxID=2530372 RepID=A0A4R5CTL3_9ACTN|nr:3-oxo-tetronate kinase [Jiangella asiatica]TDE01145.1 four-carbon acid sugar kinase family protein [Jiangella asiatica]